ncbi:unnamed protein product [Pieris macdunnoughi]|uniref:Ig-like domain-containing protein n=1 Tax=Pieris macdunnoughi TaxID=345717 RepID=A0A821UC82_9NEOP|nr:unnamed protein product [Pieris macdunnoughi]
MLIKPKVNETTVLKQIPSIVSLGPAHRVEPVQFGTIRLFWFKAILEYSKLERFSYKGQTVEITPREAVRRVGDDLTVLCKVSYPIDSCRMTVGSTPYRLIPSQQDEEVVYSGQGLQFGECGAHIKHIKEEWNGNISCMLPPPSGSIEVTGIMRLVVAKPPANPQLISPPQSNFKEGDVFMAQCIVPNGRPVAKITWFLDDDQFLTGVHQPIITSEPGIDLETISQNITKELSADDNGKRLVCRAEHEALDSPREAARQLVVYYPPKRTEAGQVTIFGLKIGSEGRLNVTVRANPPPEAQWTVGELVLAAPQKNEDSSITALEPVHLGGGYYNVTLVLTAVAKEDVDRTYYLRVSNDLGREEFALRLSTMDEPAGVELSPGAIAGIVVAILLLITLVSLTVFAKATDRWCFAGRSHRTDIPDGADSEAPLPPHDDIKGSENPTHEHGDFISNGDTKHPEKKPDTAV